jgi:pimeloyl-ACP methyl ester carboxylesterase
MLAKSTFFLIENYLSILLKRSRMRLMLLKKDKFDLEYWDNQGKGSALLFIHGLGVDAKYQWFRQLRTFSKKHRILMPNLLGFGDSVSKVDDYTVDAQVEALYNFIVELKIDKISVVGVSYGGLVASEFARLHPDFVEKLVFFDAPVKFVDDTDVTRVLAEFEVENLEKLFIPNHPLGLKVLYTAATGGNLPISASFLAEFHKKRILNSSKAKEMIIASMLAHMDKYRNIDYQFHFPVCMIWGDNDPIVPISVAQELLSYLGEGTQLHIIRKGGHMPNVVRPRLFNRVLSEFIISC